MKFATPRCVCSDNGYPDGTCPYCVRLQREAAARATAIEPGTHLSDIGFGSTVLPPAVYNVFHDDSDDLDWHSTILPAA